MSLIHQLVKIKGKSQKRLGRGYGSGVGGHTVGRGAKGDKARGKTKITFDGTKIKKSWIKRLPFYRGKHRLNSQKVVLTLSLSSLAAVFPKTAEINPAKIKEKIPSQVPQRPFYIKILSRGQISHALHLKGIQVSAAARKKIIGAGGSID